VKFEISKQLESKERLHSDTQLERLGKIGEKYKDGNRV
jgi:hypothetical protein